MIEIKCVCIKCPNGKR